MCSIAGIDKNLGATDILFGIGLFDQDQGDILTVVGDGTQMPGYIFRAFTQKVIVTRIVPEVEAGIRIKALCGH